MFIDYVTLTLINMVAGLVVLAAYLWNGVDDPNQGRWAPAFAMPGLIALMNGFHTAWTWPLPGSYNVAFGDLSVMLGILFLGAALALAKGWDLLPITIYAFFAGLAALLAGVRFISLQLSMKPALTGVGFILTGLGGVFAGPVLLRPKARQLRKLGAVVLVAAAAIWALTGYLGFWMHLEGFKTWVPLLMRK